MKKMKNMKKLGFGLMRLPLINGEDYQSVNQALTEKMVDCFLEQGFTYFDTAYVYHGGISEGVFKKAVLARHPRDTFTIADKMPTWLVKDSGDYQKFFDEQLVRCGVDYFDYYLLHNLSVKSYADTVKHGGFEFVKNLKAQGKARNIGFSFHDKAHVLDTILTEHPEMEFVQLQINYLDWDNEGIQSRQCYETAVKHGKPVIVMEPVKGGCLANIPAEVSNLLKSHNPAMSAASWAIRFAASLEQVLVVLSGMSTLEQVTDNVSYMQDLKPLTKEERGFITQVTEIINRKIAIPCTSCAYCIEGCPQKIPIPQYFALYNNHKQFGPVPTIRASYTLISGNGGKASECIACQQCEEHCPQHIAITEQLKAVATVFEKT